jgi:GntR family transcriptional regulator
LPRPASAVRASPDTAMTVPPAPLLRQGAEPLYRQLAARLAQSISSGSLACGGRLPTEPELMSSYGVSRITVRQAIALLVRNGQVVTRPGKGTFVTSPLMRHDLGALRGFYDALREQGLEPTTELLEFSVSAGRADAELPANLDLPVKLRRRYLLDTTPFAIVEAWLPAAAGTLGEARAAQLAVYEIIERYLGERVAVADVAIRCQPASPAIAGQLGLPKKSAVLVMERRSESLSGKVLEFMRIHIVPERYEFRLRVPGPLEITNSVRQSALPTRSIR